MRDHLIVVTKPARRPDWMSPYEHARTLDTLTEQEFQAGAKILLTTFLCPKQTPDGVLEA